MCPEFPSIKFDIFLSIGMIRAGTSDRRQFKQDDLKVEFCCDLRFLEWFSAMRFGRHELALNGDIHARGSRDVFGFRYAVLA